MYKGKLAVLLEQSADLTAHQQLADRLQVPLYQSIDPHISESFFLTWRDGCLKLLDKELLKKGGISVDIEPRPGEQRSWPAPKEGALAHAIGRKTKTVIDATCGWGQDSLHIFRMGYKLTCIERSPIMHALLQDAFCRLEHLSWMQNLQLSAPILLKGDASALFASLAVAPDCIYLDPMFPPKKKKSALAKKSMQVLRELIGDDLDKEALLASALAATGKKVVVKCPDDAEPLGGKPTDSFTSKLVRYDVYLKS